MRRNNTKPKRPVLNTKSNHSFRTGNMLSHPSGIETFKVKSALVAKDRQQKKDSQMLRKSAHFEKGGRSSGEISSQLEDPQSQIKAYKIVPTYRYVNGQLVQSTEVVWLKRNESSQLPDVEGKVPQYLNAYDKKHPQKEKEKQKKLKPKNKMEGFWKESSHRYMEDLFQ